MPKTKEAKDQRKASAKEAKKEKQLIKAHKKKAKEQGLSVEEEDIETLLKQFDVKKLPPPEVHGKLIPCDQPSPRSSSTFTQLPGGDYFLFGGEFYEGSKVVVYNEGYRWNADKNEWRLVDPPIAPKPRCSHQAAVYKDSLYVFGGEFATIEQFHHFRDLWKFNPKTNTWEEVQCTGVGPSARSGHRMVVWKSQLVVFGGFHDTLRETRYFNDVHVLNLQTLRWSKVTLLPHNPAPSPRSGVLMACHAQGDGILVCGGYCKVKDTQKNAQGKMLQDAWWLNMQQVNSAIASKLAQGNVWEKLGKKASLASIRSGASCITHKSMAICFGGVCDEDDGGLSLRSVFYNDLHAFDLERKRWHTMKLCIGPEKSSKKSKKSQPIAALDQNDVPAGAEEEKEEAFQYDSDEDEDATTFGYIDQDGKLVRIKIDDFNFTRPDDSPTTTAMTTKTTETATKTTTEMATKTIATDQPTVEQIPIDQELPIADEAEGLIRGNRKDDEKQTDGATQQPVIIPLEPDLETPLPRLNACLAMKGNELLIYGGLVELGKKELTLDDCWSINLNTRKKWTCMLKGHLEDHPWNEEEEEDDDDDDDDGDFSDDNSDDGNSSDSSSEHSGSDEEKKKREKKKNVKKFARIKDEILDLRNRLSLGSAEQTPQVSETLRDFFERTKNYWMERYHKESGCEERSRDEKVMRRGGFELASRRFEQLHPTLQRLEELELRQAEEENKEKKKK